MKTAEYGTKSYKTIYNIKSTKILINNKFSSLAIMAVFRIIKAKLHEQKNIAKIKPA